MTVTKINLERQQKDKKCAVNKQKKSTCKMQKQTPSSQKQSDLRQKKAKSKNGFVAKQIA